MTDAPATLRTIIRWTVRRHPVVAFVVAQIKAVHAWGDGRELDYAKVY